MKMTLVRSMLLATALCGVSAISHAAPNQADGAPSAPSAAAVQAMVNLNTADAETLGRELIGIGATKAQAIVAYRQAHGPFQSVDELLEVKGIGAATLEKNRSKLQL